MGNLTIKESGEMVNIISPNVSKITSFKVYFSPKQEGTGDPSPENVREITGWNGVETNTAQRNIYANTKNIYRKIFIPSGTTWTASCDGGGYVYVYDTNQKYIDSWALSGTDETSGRRYKTVTISSYDIYYVRINGNKCQNPQFEFGALSEYEPVVENSITFPSDIGTVYGGYVDWVSGELVADRAVKTFDGSETWDIATVSSKTAYQTRRPADIASGAVFTSNIISRVASLSGTVPNNVGYFGGTYLNVYAPSLSLEEWIAMLTATPLQIVYKLAEPITHQLTSQQLSTLKGQNNFWSNADYIEIEYELTETFDIQKAKRKIILNQPHVESASGDLVTFDTDMKGKLKECKVYFSPVQEGEGDPSPDNVRNITGWNGVSAGLPDEYQEVEWIQSTEREQFILLPYGFEETDTITITASIGTEYSTDKFIIAPRKWNNNDNRFAMVGVFKDMYCIGYGNHTTNYTCLKPMTNNDGNMHTWTFANKVFEITDLGLSIDVSNITFGGVTSNLKLFYGYNQNINGKLSYYKHVKLNGEVYEFIPCYRKSDDEIGLYDIKNHVFYTNDGTGSFLKGKDVNNITTNINWTDNIGTVYGGYVDLISGELVVDRAMLSFDEATLYKDNGTYKLWMVKKLPRSVNIYGGRAICNITKSFGYVPSTALETKIQFPYGTNLILFASIPADFNIADVQVVYELADPIHYQLTPQQLLTLKGINNVYSDTNGQMEIKYWKH